MGEIESKDKMIDELNKELDENRKKKKSRDKIIIEYEDAI